MNTDKEKATLFVFQVFFRQEMNRMKTEENERLGIRVHKPLIGVTMKYLKARANHIQGTESVTPLEGGAGAQ